MSQSDADSLAAEKLEADKKAAEDAATTTAAAASAWPTGGMATNSVFTFYLPHEYTIQVATGTLEVHISCRPVQLAAETALTTDCGDYHNVRAAQRKALEAKNYSSRRLEKRGGSSGGAVGRWLFRWIRWTGDLISVKAGVQTQRSVKRCMKVVMEGLVKGSEGTSVLRAGDVHENHQGMYMATKMIG
ncbi:uncharacterized protein LOC119292819 [Triticum dicoccoides]|uniref:uncharacterized protein LOC119292819 n=1 Tax=Triticum dicoccoides TaxID=85692 RepID=UPI00188E9952|nr:uncharacterized protein LOC119292819 [Triticum dicoccoides]